MRQRMIGVILICSMFVIIGCFTNEVQAKEKKVEQVDLPKNIMSIENNNTIPNVSEDNELVEENKLTKELIDALEIPLKNPDLIRLLNETTVRPSPIGIGYRGMIYLGRWPLTYESTERTVNADYQLINENKLNNSGGNSTKNVHYIQLSEKRVKGALSTKLDDAAVVKRMMLHTVKDATKLPVSYTAVVGIKSELANFYNVPVDKQGELRAYVPAIHEKGMVTYGEVYLQLKGSSKSLVVKNVTKQSVGAWMPIQDHLALSFQLK